MAPYRYSPLRAERNEIRLIHLLPGNHEDPLKIRMVHSTIPVAPSCLPMTSISSTEIEALSNAVRFPWSVEETEDGELFFFHVVTGQMQVISQPVQVLQNPTPPTEDAGVNQLQYEALSYTWGAGEITECAQVESNDQGTGRTTLGMRPNLSSALRHLRLPSETRVLWIDAMCINQEDLQERSEQVKRMAAIYTLAHRVLVWLGEEADDSTLALSTLQHIGRQLSTTKSGRLIAAPDAAEPRLWRNEHAAVLPLRAWQALMSLVERPWFYRIWCWQEIKLGGGQATLVCGRDTIAWRDFWRAVLCLHNKDSLPSIWFRERCRHIVFLKVEATAISSILDISRSKGCSDPRDKIYGLLGITPANFAAGIEVDYSRPAAEVYKEAFMTHLESTQRLELLKHCDIANHRPGGPTWVPDWSKTEFAAPLLSEQLSAGISRAWFAYPESDVLEVVGIRHATIISIGEVASKSTKETLLAIKSWIHHLPEGDNYVTGESIDSAFILTLCMNRTRERYPYIHVMSTAEHIIMLHRILALTAEAEDNPIYSERETANMIQKIRGRRFFVTDSGHIGTAPAGVEVGDSTCLVLGTYAPIVLRPTHNGSWQVVGECYVHGLADTVGILGPIPHPWRPIVKGDSWGRPMSCFLNCRTGEETMEDPRLGSLPRGWQRADYERSGGDPDMIQKFQNVHTGQVVNYDPRLSPDLLKEKFGGLGVLKLV